MPARSRRSTKTRPPWSRRRATQPATRHARAGVAGAQLAAASRVRNDSPGKLLHAARPAPRVAARPRSYHAPSRCSRSHSSRRRRSRPARRPAWRPAPAPLQPAAAEVGVGRHAGARGPRPAARAAAARACSAITANSTSPPARGAAGGRARARAQPLEPGAEADAGRRRAADLLGQAVVAAAARDRDLGASPAALQLPGGARVVVEAAHQRRHRARRRRRARRGGARTSAKWAAQSSHRWSVMRGASASTAWQRRVLAVEHAQRVGLAPLAALVVELVDAGVDELDEQLPRRPGRQVASPIEFSSQLELRHAAQPVPAVLQRDHLGVDRRVGRADHLDAELVVLAGAAALRARCSGTWLWQYQTLTGCGSARPCSR